MDARRTVDAATGPGEGRDHGRALGEALLSRVDDCWRRCEQQLAEAGIFEVGTPEFRSHRRACQKVGIELMARWLMTGEQSTQEERAFLGSLGEMAARADVSINHMARGYLMFRDTVSGLIDEEAERLHSPAPAVRAAKRVNSSSVDASIVWMTHAYDRQKVAQEAALAESEARFRGVYESMAAGVVVVSPDGVILSANRAAAEMLEIPIAQLVGAAVAGAADYYRDEQGRRLERSPITEAVELRAPIRGRMLRHDRGDGRPPRWHQLDLVPIFTADGELSQVLATISDVTVVKVAEELRAESEAKNRFLATMSHELRTPLNSILGFAQLLGSQSGKLEEQQKRDLANIDSSGKHLLTLINHVLELSRVTFGEVTLNLEDTQLVTVIQDVADEFEPMLANQPVLLKMDLEPWLRARIDARRFKQVLVNLVANALKFTEQGTVTVESRGADEHVEVRVIDTGVGIPADQLDRVFDEFTQVDDGSTRSRGGTGLGLALSRRLVEMMGGTLTLRSTLGQGTTAIVRLPTVRD